MPLRPAATTSFNNWDFHNHHVQSELIGGEFVSAETTLIAAGPPRLTDITGGSSDVGGGGGVIDTPDEGDMVFPIGVLENVGLSQSKQLQRIFEIGSSRSYFVPGRTIGSLTLGRVLYHGPSLMKVLYAHYKQTSSSAPFQFMNDGIGATINIGGVDVPDPNATLLNLPALQAELHQVQSNPGYDDLWLNLASDIFNQPTGMAIYFRNQLDITVGAIYLEECYVQGHQMSISSGSVLVMEGVSLQFDQVRPIRMNLAGVGAPLFANQ
jgi:hypothetical protein